MALYGWQRPCLTSHIEYVVLVETAFLDHLHQAISALTAVHLGVRKNYFALKERLLKT